MKGPFEENAPLTTIACDDLQVPVLAAGKGWLAVDKPAGMSVHNDSGLDLCSIVSVFLQSDATVEEQTGMDWDFGVHPVHRLDKETSGVLLLAVTRKAFRHLSHQFESRLVKKRYIALLHGPLEDPEGSDSWGSWQWALSKSAGGRDNPEGRGALVESRTLYRVLDRSTHYSMAEIELLSGRIHQIRRHAKLAGHPVVGDARYGSTRAIEYLRRNCAFERLALHALALTFRPPDGKEVQNVRTPAIPGSMRKLFENDRTGVES